MKASSFYPVILISGDELANRIVGEIRSLSKKFLSVTELNPGNVARRCSEINPQLLLLCFRMLTQEVIHLLYDLRTETTVPVLLFLSSAQSEQHLLQAYAAGADDCVLLNANGNGALLVAKIEAWLRRCMLFPTEFLNPVRVGAFHLIPLEQSLVAPGEVTLHLTTIETRLLYILMSRAGQTVTYEELLYRIWNTHAEGSMERSCLKNVIYRLRTKLQQASVCSDCLQTVSGCGYKFVLVECD